MSAAPPAFLAALADLQARQAPRYRPLPPAPVDASAVASWLCLDTRTKHRLLKAAGFPDPLAVIDKRLHQLTDAERALIAAEVRSTDYGCAAWGLANL